LCLSASVAGQHGSEAQHLQFQRRLQSVDSIAARVKDVKANFKQERKTPLLKRPMTSSGVVQSVAGVIRWDTREPYPSAMVISKDLVELYYPADALIELYPLGQNMRGIVGSPIPRLGILRRQFTIGPLAGDSLLQGADDPAMLGIELRPLSADLRNHLTAIHMLIIESQGIVARLRVIGLDGEETDITFSDVQINSGLDSRALRLETSSDVRRVWPAGRPGTQEANQS
jgi:outer membrane lipoprotein-sorting protein